MQEPYDKEELEAWDKMWADLPNLLWAGGDYVTIPTYKIDTAIDWTIQHANDNRWDVLHGAMKALNESLTKK